nr:uncharacterized protein LOC128703347 [Cherax quadricarinatus]
MDGASGTLSMTTPEAVWIPGHQGCLGPGGVYGSDVSGKDVTDGGTGSVVPSEKWMYQANIFTHMPVKFPKSKCFTHIAAGTCYDNDQSLLGSGGILALPEGNKQPVYDTSVKTPPESQECSVYGSNNGLALPKDAWSCSWERCSEREEHQRRSVYFKPLLHSVCRPNSEQTISVKTKFTKNNCYKTKSLLYHTSEYFCAPTNCTRRDLRANSQNSVKTCFRLPVGYLKLRLPIVTSKLDMGAVLVVIGVVAMVVSCCEALPTLPQALPTLHQALPTQPPNPQSNASSISQETEALRRGRGVSVSASNKSADGGVTWYHQNLMNAELGAKVPHVLMNSVPLSDKRTLGRNMQDMS